jgi:hypothetical protein
MLAVVGATVMGFLTSPAGQAVLHQYPILAPVVAFITFLSAFYHIPKVS